MSCICGTSTALFRILKLVLIAVVGNVDQIVCFFVVLTSCPGLSRLVRWNTRSCSPLSCHRTVPQDCSRRCNADSGLFSPAVGPLFSPTVVPLFSPAVGPLLPPWCLLGLLGTSRCTRLSVASCTTFSLVNCSLVCSMLTHVLRVVCWTDQPSRTSLSCPGDQPECGCERASLVLLWPLGRHPAKSP